MFQPAHICILPLYKAKHDRMIADDVIIEITESTDVIVCNIKNTADSKKTVRLYLDAKDLNENISYEHYYSIIIAWQEVYVCDAYHKKVIFIGNSIMNPVWTGTESGDYLWESYHHGYFQCKLDEVYKDILNVTDIANDIIVGRSITQEHDQAFIKVPEATHRYNLSLTSGKLQFK